MRIFYALMSLISITAVAIFATLVFSGRAAGQGPSDCRAGDVLDGVHDPERLQVINSCVLARGTVAVVHHDEDGDWHVGLIPDPTDLHLLSTGNAKVGGLLVIEVIPKDQSAVNLPQIGSRIEVIGAYVIDKPWGWHEIHPAWEIHEIAPSPLPPSVQEKIISLAVYAKRVMVALRGE